MATIRKGGTRQIRKNFNEKYLGSGSWLRGYTDAVIEFELSDNSLDGLQWLRDFLNTVINVNSTGRSPRHNDAVNSHDSSMHYMDGTQIIRAIDFTIPDKQLFNVLYWDIKNKGVIYQTLRKRFGLSIGLYGTFFHIDDGQGAGVSSKNIYTDTFGKFGLWDTTSKKKALTKTYIILSKLKALGYMFPQEIKK